MLKAWYKIASVVLIAYSVFAGLLLPVPRLNILNETIRNLYFHVPMWFGMIVLGAASVVYSVLFLNKNDKKYDHRAYALMTISTLFGMAGLFTGMLWANYTWGAPWSWDVKQNTTAISLLLMFAYFILRTSMDDEEKQARISAVYNIFAYVAIIPLIFIVPKLTASLHPGMGGNPAFSKYDLDNDMRLVFYPAVLGWIFMGFWISNIYYRIIKLKNE